MVRLILIELGKFLLILLPTISNAVDLLKEEEGLGTTIDQAGHFESRECVYYSIEDR